MFSFGIVLWELLTGEEPYADLHYGAIIGNAFIPSMSCSIYLYGITTCVSLIIASPKCLSGGIVSNTLRPPVPESCDPEWRSLMERCWSSEPSDRPSFTEVVNDLRAMAAKIPPKGQNPTQQLSATKPQVQK